MKVVDVLENDEWTDQPITRKLLDKKQRSACLEFMIYLQRLTDKYPGWTLSPLNGVPMASQLSWLSNAKYTQHLLSVLPNWSADLNKFATPQEGKTYDDKIRRVIIAKGEVRAAIRGKMK